MEELQDILDGCRKGDAYWQQRLYDTYSSRFYAFCLRYAPCETEAEDILVEGFTKVFLSLESFRGDGSFVSWMYRIFTSVAISHYRKNSTSREILAQTTEHEEAESHDSTMSMDVQQAMQKAMQLLTDKQRIVFNMIAIEGYTVAEVVAKLPMPKSTVRHHYTTAKETMRSTLRHLLDGKYLTQ